MAEPKNPLRYSILRKGPLQLVAFEGYLSGDSESALNACVAELVDNPGEWVVISFRGVLTEIERPIFRGLVQMQKMIRDRGKRLRVAELPAKLASLLIEHAVIRQEELHAGLTEAVKSFVTAEPPRAAKVFSSRG